LLFLCAICRVALDAALAACFLLFSFAAAGLPIAMSQRFSVFLGAIGVVALPLLYMFSQSWAS
jgi:hypothetical protein